VSNVDRDNIPALKISFHIPGGHKAIKQKSIVGPKKVFEKSIFESM
jgi:hypothetical protein